MVGTGVGSRSLAPRPACLLYAGMFAQNHFLVAFRPSPCFVYCEKISVSPRYHPLSYLVCSNYRQNRPLCTLGGHGVYVTTSSPTLKRFTHPSCCPYWFKSFLVGLALNVQMHVRLGQLLCTFTVSFFSLGGCCQNKKHEHHIISVFG